MPIGLRVPPKLRPGDRVAVLSWGSRTGTWRRTDGSGRSATTPVGCREFGHTDPQWVLP